MTRCLNLLSGQLSGTYYGWFYNQLSGKPAADIADALQLTKSVANFQHDLTPFDRNSVRRERFQRAAFIGSTAKLYSRSAWLSSDFFREVNPVEGAAETLLAAIKESPPESIANLADLTGRKASNLSRGKTSNHNPFYFIQRKLVVAPII